MYVLDVVQCMRVLSSRVVSRSITYTLNVPKAVKEEMSSDLISFESSSMVKSSSGRAD